MFGVCLLFFLAEHFVLVWPVVLEPNLHPRLTYQVKLSFTFTDLNILEVEIC